MPLDYPIPSPSREDASSLSLATTGSFIMPEIVISILQSRRGAGLGQQTSYRRRKAQKQYALTI